MKSIVRFFAVAALFCGIIISVSSCGTQKMGCPGSITKAEQSQPARS